MRSGLTVWGGSTRRGRLYAPRASPFCSAPLLRMLVVASLVIGALPREQRACLGSCRTLNNKWSLRYLFEINNLWRSMRINSH
jgi:hypothetical protein